MNFTEKIANSLVKSDYSTLPRNTIERTKAVLLDYFACVLAGSKAPGISQVSSMAQQLGPGGHCSVLVLGGKIQPNWAALVNSAMGHATDFDDTFDSAVLHTSTVVVPAALAAAEHAGSSGRSFIHAVALGMDLHCRLGRVATIQPAELGWIYTPLLGVFGSAAASACILQLGKEETLNALGISYCMASGNHQALNEGTLAKRLQPAFASSNGLMAVLLSKAGITGPHQPFEGVFGLFNVYLRGKVEPQRAVEALGAKFFVDELSLKPYPCCRHTHTSIDAIIQAHKAGIKAEDIAEIKLEVNPAAYAAVCEPQELKYAPRTVVDAQFSLPYVVACALVQGWVYLDDFTTEAITRREILKSAAKVKASIDSELGRQDMRNITPVKATIKMTNGSVKRIAVRSPKGSLSNPMSDSDFRRKLTDCATHSAIPFDSQAMDEIVTNVMNLEDSPTVAGLMQTLSPARLPKQVTHFREG